MERAELMAMMAELSLSGNAIGPAGVRYLAASPFLARLSALYLESAGLGAGEVGTLAATPWLPRLRKLALGNNRLGPEGASLLAALPLTRWEVLDLHTNSVVGTIPAGDAR